MNRGDGIATRNHRTTHLELGMDLAVWLQAMHEPPSWRAIQARLSCSRAMAYRYRQSIVDFMERRQARAA